MSVVQTLILLMQADGLSKAELSRRLGVSQAHGCDIVNGNRKVSAGIAVRLEGIFGVPAEAWLWERMLEDVAEARAENPSLRVLP